VVYEAAGRVQRRWLDHGAALVDRAAQTYRMPVEVVDRDPADHAAWLGAMRAGVDRVLGGQHGPGPGPASAPRAH
jgi:hypothetical protein